MIGMDQCARLVLPFAIELGIPAIWLGFETLLTTSSLFHAFGEHAFHLATVFLHSIDQRALLVFFFVHLVTVTVQGQQMFDLIL